MWSSVKKRTCRPCVAYREMKPSHLADVSTNVPVAVDFCGLQRVNREKLLNFVPEMESQRSVYRRGAEDGLIMGPLMALVVILMGACGRVPVLGIPALVGICLVPIVAYVMLSRGYREDNCQSTFSALCMQGISTFFFGGLLMAVVIYVSLRWVWPTYIADQMRFLSEILAQQPGPEAKQLTDMVDKLIATGNVPTPIEVALEQLYIVVFTGSLLSLFLSLVIRSRRQPTPPKYDNN